MSVAMLTFLGLLFVHAGLDGVTSPPDGDRVPDVVIEALPHHHLTIIIVIIIIIIIIITLTCFSWSPMTSLTRTLPASSPSSSVSPASCTQHIVKYSRNIVVISTTDTDYRPDCPSSA